MYYTFEANPLNPSVVLNIFLLYNLDWLDRLTVMKVRRKLTFPDVCRRNDFRQFTI